MKTIGSRIRELRKAKGWSIETLADTAGMSKMGIWNIEKGRNSGTSIYSLITIAESLGTTIGYICGESDKSESQDTAFFVLYKRLPEKEKKFMRSVLRIVVENVRVSLRK